MSPNNPSPFPQRQVILQKFQQPPRRGRQDGRLLPQPCKLLLFGATSIDHFQLQCIARAAKPFRLGRENRAVRTGLEKMWAAGNEVSWWVYQGFSQKMNTATFLGNYGQVGYLQNS